MDLRSSLKPLETDYEMVSEADPFENQPRMPLLNSSEITWTDSEIQQQPKQIKTSPPRPKSIKPPLAKASMITYT